MPIAAILLAAGASRRLGQPKQLVEIDGEPLIARALRAAHEAGADPVIAVLGAHFDAVSAAVKDFGDIRVAYNGQWEEGIASSIRAGLRALAADAPGTGGALILACDQPRLTVSHLRALMAAFESHSASSIAASAYAGVIGIPAIFPPSAFAALQALRGDIGARALLTKPPCGLVAVPFDGGAWDIDEPWDLDGLS